MKYSVRGYSCSLCPTTPTASFFFFKTRNSTNVQQRDPIITNFKIQTHKKCQGCGGNCFNTAHWQTVIEIKKMSNYFASSKQAIHNIHARFDENLI